MKSDYITCEREKIEGILLSIARQRIFLEAANYVIIGCREEFKQKWIESFKKADEFKTREEALTRLTSRREFSERQENFVQYISRNNLEIRLDEILNVFYGESRELKIGHGNWINLMRGKEFLSTIINQCFQVRDDTSRKILQGEKARDRVIKNLLRKNLSEQPNDFQELCRLIKRRINTN